MGQHTLTKTATPKKLQAKTNNWQQMALKVRPLRWLPCRNWLSASRTDVSSLQSLCRPHTSCPFLPSRIPLPSKHNRFVSCN